MSKTSTRQSNSVENSQTPNALFCSEKYRVLPASYQWCILSSSYHMISAGHNCFNAQLSQAHTHLTITLMSSDLLAVCSRYQVSVPGPTLEPILSRALSTDWTGMQDVSWERPCVFFFCEKNGYQMNSVIKWQVVDVMCLHGDIEKECDGTIHTRRFVTSWSDDPPQLAVAVKSKSKQHGKTIT